MRFNQLDDKAKSVAVNDYINGWKETHPEETFTTKEATEFCIDSEDDVSYNEKGNLL